MNHYEDYAPDVNYGNLYPDDWYFYGDELGEIDVSKTLESNKKLLEHPFFN